MLNCDYVTWMYVSMFTIFLIDINICGSFIDTCLTLILRNFVLTIITVFLAVFATDIGLVL